MEIPEIYKGLNPTDKTYQAYKPLYLKVKKSVLEKFPEIRINDPIINRKIYEQIGYPMWDKTKIGNPVGPGIDAIPWQMNEGNRRGIKSRRKSQKKSGGKRYKTTRANLSKVKQEYFDEAGKLWDELVGNPKGSFTLNGQTFNNRLHYQNWEVKRQVLLDEKYQKLNKTRGMTHGHALPPENPLARESRLQSFAEEASGNFASQDRLPTDYDARLKKAGIPLGEDVAKQAVGTAEKIGDPLKSKQIEAILKGTKQTKNYSTVGGYVRSASQAAKAGQTSKALKAGIGLATLGSLSVIGPAGAALSAVDAYQRQQKYRQTGNKLDGIQAWMAGASTVTGATGIGEVVSMPLDIINLIVDAARYKRKEKYSYEDRRRFRH